MWLWLLVLRTWHSTHLLCGTATALQVCSGGFGLRLGERGAEGWVGSVGAWATGIIEPGLQHRCGTGWSSCLQQLVCEPGPREVSQPQGREQGACIQGFRVMVWWERAVHPAAMLAASAGVTDQREHTHFPFLSLSPLLRVI